MSTAKNIFLSIHDMPLAASTRRVGVTVDAGASVISTGIKGYVRCPLTGQFSAWSLVADQAGDLVFDVWVHSWGTLPTDSDSITGGNGPTLSSAAMASDTTLSGWTKPVNAGDVIAFNVDSASTVTRVTLVLEIKP